MGLFHKKTKNRVNTFNKRDLIPCDRAFLSPPEGYGHGKPPKKLQGFTWEAYKTILAHFQNENLQIPINTSSKKLLTLVPEEKFWLTRECMLRYLKGNKGNVQAAIEKLEETLVWRREVGLTVVRKDTKPLDSDLVSPENETGKEVILGFDQKGRPLLYMKNGRQNTEPSFRQVQLLIYIMEAATTFCPQGVESLTVLIDFKHYKEPGIISDKMPPMSISKLSLNVMQNHYPERLGQGILINIPWFAWAFLKMMYPFLDPETRQKVIFDEPFEKYIDPSQLDAIYNGRLDFHYKHEIYWPDLTAKVKKVKEIQYSRFLKFGGIAGISEFDLKGDRDELICPPECQGVI
ncbi:hypothetical protein ZYGM_001160 [Zygosaccharomyces mellis]|uniref:CRAL-TRIO domain-containing protein n=1 Tax=Zygosaccharomyces mellis TaxID=42258 RepID=A0A4C2EAM3_9SACH|nr:hypothetical protein ZYGM_001160 [Zygosaccharomyces mellis]